MPYLIDGHNLIGRMRGISLQDPDDEARLIARLRAFCARRATTATVYFDGAVIGSTQGQGRGGLTARFVARPATADAAIRRHLERLGRETPNWTVVTSDAAVAEAARRLGAPVESSGAFARKLADATAAPPGSEKSEAPPTPQEIARWEEAFRNPPKGRGRA